MEFDGAPVDWFAARLLSEIILKKGNAIRLVHRLGHIGFAVTTVYQVRVDSKLASSFIVGTQELRVTRQIKAAQCQVVSEAPPSVHGARQRNRKLPGDGKLMVDDGRQLQRCSLFLPFVGEKAMEGKALHPPKRRTRFTPNSNHAWIRV